MMKSFLSHKGEKALILGYLCGMYTLQILFDICSSGTLTPDDCHEADQIIASLLEHLESIKSKNSVNKTFFGKSSNKKTNFSKTLEDVSESRKLINTVATEKYSKSRMQMEKGNATGDTVNMLNEACILYQISLVMFPTTEENNDDEMSPSDGLEEKTLVGKEEDLADGKEERKEDLQGNSTVFNGEEDSMDDDAKTEEQNTSETNDTNKNDFEKQIQSLQDEAELQAHELEGPVASLIAAEEPLKVEQLLTNSIIKQRISYCKYHSRRIMVCFKTGKDPNEDLMGLLNPNIPVDSDEEEEIKQEDIDKTIKSVLQTPDDAYDYDEVYLSSDEEGEGGAVLFPKAPTNREANEEGEISNTDPRSIPELPKRDYSVADAVAKNVSKARLASPKASPAPKVPVTLESLEKELSNEELLSAASKACKFAISAITYGDVDTVIAELKEALNLAEKYKSATDT
ncbi:unnamed protein product [Kuraishia capsulata CBS 1993]|uniref:Vta1 C-terminal domain-containing protein n=1 Tax=Kuraishia capsulata CBS 1993 TaxID=1382522 RepID=W6MRY6_9ASCO|nr:uncharacterized protein KUCA_T00005462001 [Kuraishia capsulata CBS 1993]CDK29474.1 unnamed protein product [Kuraishia capsulata CBS 1993]